MIFANVSDIIIPEGNIIKIHETNSGRVLWEKKVSDINPYWEVIDAQIVNADDQPIHLAKLISSETTPHASLVGNGRTIRYVNNNPIEHEHWGQYGKITTAGGNIVHVGASHTIDDRVIAMTDDINSINGTGIVYLLRNGSYYFSKSLNGVSLNTGMLFKTKAPISEYSVHITHSPERNEYLVTGLSGGTSCILPQNFMSLDSLTYQSGKPVSTFINSSWCPQLNAYYAANGLDKKVYYSNDGISWYDVIAVDKGNVFDVFFLSKQNELCAISNNQVSLSNDGVAWSHFDAPFDDAYIAAYSDDTGYLVVVNNKKAYITYDFNKWVEVALPSNRNVDFVDLIYFEQGVFIGTHKTITPIGSSPYKPREFYMLSLSVPYSVHVDEKYKVDSSL